MANPRGRIPGRIAPRPPRARFGAGSYPDFANRSTSTRRFRPVLPQFFLLAEAALSAVWS